MENSSLMLNYHWGFRKVRVCAETDGELLALHTCFWMWGFLYYRWLKSTDVIVLIAGIWKIFVKCYFCQTRKDTFKRAGVKLVVLMVCIRVESSVLELNNFVCKFVVVHLLFAISTFSNIEYLWCSSWSNPVEKCHLWTCKRGKFKSKVCVISCLTKSLWASRMSYSVQEMSSSEALHILTSPRSRKVLTTPVLCLCGISYLIKGAPSSHWITFLKGRIAKGRP